MSFSPTPGSSKPPKERQSTAYRLTMPHVITQWKPGQFSRDGSSTKERIRAEKRAGDALKSTKSPSKKQNDGISPSGISTPATPKSKRWDFGTIRHRKQASSEVTLASPDSAISPVFEMEHIESAVSPNSSVDSSPWVFELEDTSQIALHSKRSMYPGPQLEFQSSAITSRSVIKVIDQTIAAIEADNRKLLTRAITAEATVKALREHNFNLQLQVDHCERSHRRQPRSVASQPTLRQNRPKPPVPSQSAQSLAFDKLVTQFPKPKSAPKKPSSTKSAPIKCHSPASSYTSFTPVTHSSNKPLPSTPVRPIISSEPPSGLSQSPSQVSPVKPLFAPRTPPQFSPIIRSSPPRRVSRRMSKHVKFPSSSVNEAGRRSKPLPPTGPQSPSIVQGQIEIGLGIGSKQYRELEGDLASNEREFITGLFSRTSPKMEEKSWI